MKTTGCFSSLLSLFRQPVKNENSCRRGQWNVDARSQAADPELAGLLAMGRQVTASPARLSTEETEILRLEGDAVSQRGTVGDRRGATTCSGSTMTGFSFNATGSSASSSTTLVSRNASIVSKKSLEAISSTASKTLKRVKSSGSLVLGSVNTRRKALRRANSQPAMSSALPDTRQEFLSKLPTDIDKVYEKARNLPHGTKLAEQDGHPHYRTFEAISVACKKVYLMHVELNDSENSNAPLDREKQRRRDNEMIKFEKDVVRFEERLEHNSSWAQHKAEYDEYVSAMTEVLQAEQTSAAKLRSGPSGLQKNNDVSDASKFLDVSAEDAAWYRQVQEHLALWEAQAEPASTISIAAPDPVRGESSAANL
ncbi:hypothetical protein DFQ28_008019 [Apophysomyces sp. BC1034]|nr:hypothetical protein DFQ30_010168 [Apophysomyces sp. BC1015]KAG0186332.1 hypothetical protein DFQ28_008019 [Apophysomyces sp. BC1034]